MNGGPAMAKRLWNYFDGNKNMFRKRKGEWNGLNGKGCYRSNIA